MDGRRGSGRLVWFGAAVSRRGFAVGELDPDGLPVVQICPNPRCRRDFHRPSERCRFCGELLARPLGAAGEDVEDDQATALEPAGEPDPELDEAWGGALVQGLWVAEHRRWVWHSTGCWARWIWLAAGLAQRRRAEARCRPDIVAVVAAAGSSSHRVWA